MERTLETQNNTYVKYIKNFEGRKNEQQTLMQEIYINSIDSDDNMNWDDDDDTNYMFIIDDILQFLILSRCEENNDDQYYRNKDIVYKNCVDFLINYGYFHYNDSRVLMFEHYRSIIRDDFGLREFGTINIGKQEYNTLLTIDECTSQLTKPCRN